MNDDEQPQPESQDPEGVDLSFLVKPSEFDSIPDNPPDELPEKVETPPETPEIADKKKARAAAKKPTKAKKTSATTSVKKTTAPKKTSKAKTEELDPFNLWDAVKEKLPEAKRHELMSLEEVPHDMISTEGDFLFEYAFRHRQGWHQRTVWAITGPEGVGKSTLAYRASMWHLKKGWLVLFIETERKMHFMDYVKRAFSSDPKEADRLSKNFQVVQVNSLDELEATIKTNIAAIRKVVPSRIPVLIVIDTFSRASSARESGELLLMNKEAKTKTEEEKKKNVDKKSITEKTARTTDHAIWMAMFMRMAPTMMSVYNVSFIITNQQTVKIDMGGGGGPQISEDVKKIRNNNRRGGSAQAAEASYDWVLTGTNLKNTSTIGNASLGKQITGFVCKNSFGPSLYKFTYDIISDFTEDTDETQVETLTTTRSVASMILASKLWTITVDKRKYSSRELGLMNATEKELVDRVLGDEITRTSLGKFYQIQGY